MKKIIGLFITALFALTFILPAQAKTPAPRCRIQPIYTCIRDESGKCEPVILAFRCAPQLRGR